MKQKEKLISSLIIAFVAGFIYYAFADFDTLVKLPSLALEKINSVIESNTSTQTAGMQPSDEKITYNSSSEKIENLFAENTSPAEIVAGIPGLDFLAAGKFQERLISQLPSVDNLVRMSSYGFDNMDYVRLVNAGIIDESLEDSIKHHIKIKISGLDTLNEYLNHSMEKLNESMAKLQESLKNQNFNFDMPDIKIEGLEDLNNMGELSEEDLKDLQNLKVEINSEDIKKQIEENMKEFQENMKDFKFDMNEFKDSMKQFKENMKDLKENMKEHKEKFHDKDSNNKEVEKEVRIIES